MKKFSELEDKDFKYLNENNIDAINRSILLGPNRIQYIRDEDLECLIEHVIWISNCRILAVNVRHDEVGCNLMYKSITFDKDIMNSGALLYPLYDYSIDEFINILTLSKDISISFIVKDKTIYVDEQLYYARKYMIFKIGIIKSSSYSWLGKLVNGEISDQNIRRLRCDCIKKTKIINCCINEVSAIDRGNFEIYNSKVNTLNIDARNGNNILGYMYRCKVEEVVIDTRRCSFYGEKVFSHIYRCKIGHMKILTTKDIFDRLKRGYYNNENTPRIDYRINIEYNE